MSLLLLLACLASAQDWSQLSRDINRFLPSQGSAAGVSLEPGMSWYWQLKGRIQAPQPAVKVYDVDLFDAAPGFAGPPGSVKVCYFSAGSLEMDDYRDCSRPAVAVSKNRRRQSRKIPASAVGARMRGWSEECWLDIRDEQVFRVMEERLDMAAAAGCAAVEPDNIDGYSHASGFGLSSDDTLAFLRRLAEAAHARGLKIGSKNADDIASRLQPFTDFAVVERCEEHDECGKYESFIRARKPVFQAEYTGYDDAKCARARARRFSLVFFNEALDGTVFQPCR